MRPPAKPDSSLNSSRKRRGAEEGRVLQLFECREWKRLAMNVKAKCMTEGTLQWQNGNYEY
ncbi:hypothetical protein E2C01_059800 [Portunus trituberculatus]|uniref:Uncharacterized protein n=1 Tax=Portunus trituberculatus TaxID=210409 RepID=A0A5B7H3L0_PORTR|nr:hypothetical protein [Portunus trituberculatus]